MAYVMYCNNCGKKLLRYEKYEIKYKSPISCCKTCGKEYIDPRCKELAIEGIPDSEFRIIYRIVLLIIGVLIAWRGGDLFGMHMLGTPEAMQFLLPSVILLLGSAIIIGAIVDMVYILTGRKRQKYDILMEESRHRMSNEEYIQKLKALGYIK